MQVTPTKRTALSMVVLAVVACETDFSPYNELTELRLLAIRSEPQSLAVGDTAELAALVYTPPGAATPAYRWSWCPFTRDLADEYECAVDQQSLQAQLDQELGPGIATVPPFDLGTGFTASLTQGLSAEELSLLCDALVQGRVGDFVEVPDCEGVLEATVRLELSLGDITISAVKRVELLIDPDHPPNLNPSIRGLFVAPESDVAAEIELPAGVRTRAEFDTTYQVRADVDPAVSEIYGVDSSQENLLFSWFYSTGETEFVRTSYLPGDIPLSTAVLNQWITPSAEVHDDHIEQLVVIVRDDRGGTGWIAREVRFR